MKVIPPNHKVGFPRFLVFVDTESNIAKEDIERYSEHTLKLGVAIYVKLDHDANVVKREVYSFKTANEFWDWCLEHTTKNDTLTIYGHNLKYDAINLNAMAELDSRGYTIPYPILNHKFIMRAHQRIGKKNCYKVKLVDTFNFTQFSLREIGKRFGKQKLDIDFGKHTEQEMITYCTVDTEIVELFILSYIRFLVTNDLGTFKDTLASTSSSIYRHKFLKEIWYHSDKGLLALERKAYFGGRTECFFKGNLPIGSYHIFDVKSMYPNVMKKTPLPYKPLQHVKSPTMDLVKRWINEGKYLIVHCRIRTNEKLNPYPVRHINDDKDYPYTSTLLFPNGDFDTYLHLPELLYAMEHKHLIKIMEVSVYEQTILFDQFVDYFYSQKETASDKTYRELSKITMNSLYGWFAKRSYDTEHIELPYDFGNGEVAFFNMTVPDETTRKTYHAWFGSLYRVTADSLTPVQYGNVALAGAITAYARMYLFEMLKVVGEKHRFYCDTDSIVTDEKGAEKLKKYIGSELGQLELQMSFGYGIINCPKDYEFFTPYVHWLIIALVSKQLRSYLWTLPIKRKARLKGVSRLSRKLEDGHYEMVRFTSFKDYMRTGKHGTVVIDKKLKRIYNKGIVKSNGFILCPSMAYVDGHSRRVA